jgi:hypothetical protein
VVVSPDVRDPNAQNIAVSELAQGQAVQGQAVRRVGKLAALLAKEFMFKQEDLDTLFIDKNDPVFDSNEFKSLCDDKTGQAQLKLVSGVERFIALWAQGKEAKKVLEQAYSCRSE